MRIDLRERTLALVVVLTLISTLAAPTPGVASHRPESPSTGDQSAWSVLWQSVTSWLEIFDINNLRGESPNVGSTAATSAAVPPGQANQTTSPPPEADDGPDMDPDG